MVNQHVEMTAIPAAAMTGQERLIVLIATRDRPDLLGQCSLPSVLQQTRAPDAVIVVDDSEVRCNRPGSPGRPCHNQGCRWPALVY